MHGSKLFWCQPTAGLNGVISHGEIPYPESPIKQTEPSNWEMTSLIGDLASWALPNHSAQILMNKYTMNCLINISVFFPIYILISKDCWFSDLNMAAVESCNNNGQAIASLPHQLGIIFFFNYWWKTNPVSTFLDYFIHDIVYIFRNSRPMYDNVLFNTTLKRVTDISKKKIPFFFAVKGPPLYSPLLGKNSRIQNLTFSLSKRNSSLHLVIALCCPYIFLPRTCINAAILTLKQLVTKWSVSEGMLEKSWVITQKISSNFILFTWVFKSLLELGKTRALARWCSFLVVLFT